MTEIKRLSRRYLYQTLAIMLALVAIALLLMVFAVCSSDILAPVIVSVVFAVAVELADALIWKWVAGQHPDSLPTFFTAVSGFRMLLAIATMVGCWVAVGREAMLSYVLVFMCFYFAVLMHHSLFFAHVSNADSKCEK